VVRSIGEHALAIASVEEDEDPVARLGNLLDHLTKIQNLQARIRRLGREQVAACVIEFNVEGLEAASPGVVALMDELNEVLVTGLGERRGEERR